MRVLSGGQTGVDRAALDAAIDLGLPVGGWCPKGRLAEDGVIPARYPLIETRSPLYAERTEWNVRDTDATLVLVLPLVVFTGIDRGWFGNDDDGATAEEQHQPGHAG